MQKVVVLAGDGDSHRQAKLTSVLRREGFNASFWVWERSAAHPVHRLSHDSRVLMRGGGSRRALLWRYQAWMLKLFLALLKLRRHTMIYCIGFDTALPAAAAATMKDFSILFDNIDNVSMSYRWPHMVQSLLGAAERWVANTSRIHLVPGTSRWPSAAANLRVVANGLSRDTLDQAVRIADERGYKRGQQFTAYVNGLLTKERGTAVILNALQRPKCANVRLIVAGRPLGVSGEQLVRHPSVEYLGVVSQPEAVAQYFRSDVAVTLYDTTLPINRVAESNKWSDCAATNTPFVVNDGVRTVAKYVQARACFTTAFTGEALADTLAALEGDRAECARAGVRISNLRTPFWDDEMADVVKAWRDASTA